jgi:hypothetical protein
MTLKQKFAKASRKSFNGHYYIIPIIEDAEIIEQIAYEFAIGFAEWFNNLKYDVMRYKTMEEHLEIYKKEKGL